MPCERPQRNAETASAAPVENVIEGGAIEFASESGTGAQGAGEVARRAI